jgi:hypothetical protein
MDRAARSWTDSDSDAERVVFEIYRRMPPWRKTQLVDEANRTARQLAMAGLRTRHPDEPVERLRRRLLGLALGERLATEVYGPLDRPR